MSLLYYILLAFGGLLVIYVLTGWFVTKKKINEYNGTENKLETFAQNVKSKLSLWVFYFSGGNRKNILRNSVISVLSFLAFFAINVSYIHIDRLTFSVIFIFTFLILIWKLGQRRNRVVFNNVFPEVIQILVAASSSGAGLLQGLERCGQELTGQLGTEFRNIHRRLAIGEDPIAVFDESYTRYPYKEFYFFITIIRTNLSKGGQIKESTVYVYGAGGKMEIKYIFNRNFIDVREQTYLYQDTSLNKVDTLNVIRYKIDYRGRVVGKKLNQYADIFEEFKRAVPFILK